jgi:CP family cyanate transporter-like MFS transporter
VIAEARRHPPLRTATAALVVALIAGTLAMRPQLTAVGPLLSRIQDDLGESHARAGLLVTVPLLCMGLFALPAARVLRRVDARAAITGCLALIVASTLLRAVAPEFGTMVALTFLFGIAAGLMGAFLPVVAKERFAERPELGTGVFALGLNAGATLGAGLAVPLANATGSWRWSLGSMAAAGALAVPAWVRLSRRSLAGTLPVETVNRLPWRSPLAWAVTLVFAFQAVCFFALNAWLADVMVERGWADGSAGALVALLNLTPLLGVLIVSLAGGRLLGVGAYLAVSATGLLIGSVGIAAGAPSTWGWVVLSGLSLGALFALSMTLSVLAGEGPGQVAAVAGMQLGVGYVVAAVAPVALGLLRDTTGSFSAGLWLVAATAGLVVCAVAAALRLLPESAR